MMLPRDILTNDALSGMDLHTSKLSIFSLFLGTQAKKRVNTSQREKKRLLLICRLSCCFCSQVGPGMLFTEDFNFF